MRNELGRLTQDFDEAKETDTKRFVKMYDIGKIPRNKVITYVCIVVDCITHKKIPAVL
jgi:hypothetical protein